MELALGAVDALEGPLAVELGFGRASADQSRSWAADAAGGLRFGALLWLVVVPVTLADTALRLAGIAPRFELLAVVVAVGLAIAGGALLGSRLGGTRRAMVAGATATLLLTIAMAGPVPLPNGRRAVAIFLSVLPACMIAGLILGLTIRIFGFPVHRRRPHAI